MSKFLKVAAVIAMASVAACASKPKVEPTPPVITAPPTPPPVYVPPVAAKPTPGSVADFVASAGERVFFGYDSFTLSAEAKQTLERQAAWLRTYTATRVLVAGNCDERGTREYNLALGARRAAAVKDYLVSLGVTPARVSTVSYGKERPIAPESTDAAWSMNRNGHTQITSGAVS